MLRMKNISVSKECRTTATIPAVVGFTLIELLLNLASVNNPDVAWLQKRSSTQR
jgi:hypothetical protein